MQIQYCDDCGTRIDDSEAVTVENHCYCAQCARNHAPVVRAGAAVLTGAPRNSGRLNRTARPASGTPAVAPARTTAGVQHADEQREYSGAEFQAPDYDATSSGSGPIAWAQRNMALAIALAAGLGGMLLFTVWTMTAPSKPSNSGTLKAATNSVPTTTTVIAPSTGPGNKIVDHTKPVATTVVVTTPVVTEAPSPRDEKSIRDLKAIKDAIAGGKTPPFDLRKRLEAYVSNDKEYRMKQWWGQEAAKLLENYKGEMRQPDKASGAVPGLTVSLIYDKAVDNFNTDFKPAEEKTIPKVEIKSQAELMTAFAHDQNIAMRITGFIEIPKDGEYSFYVSSDDGSMFYVGEWKLIDNAGSHALSEKDCTIDLKAGKHAIRIDYYQGTGAAGLIFSWSGPGLRKQVVPASALSSIPKK